MRNLSRIVWAEGMYLGPHHFQAQSRYFEETIHFSAASLWFAPFGFLGFELSKDALRNSTVLVSHARGVFEDGLTFDMPSADPLPEPRSVEKIFSPAAESLLTYLAIPNRSARGGNTSFDTNSDNAAQTSTRFFAEEQIVADEILGGDEKPGSLRSKNIQVLFENEKKDGFQLLPIARIRRDGAGHFVFDERFIPPVVRFSASPALLEIHRRLIDILTQKNLAFTGSTRGFDRQASGMSAQQISSFWFLHAVDSALATLRHLYYSKQGHPEELYTELLRLGGALCTFSLNSSAANLPAYDHWDLQASFEGLDLHIREHLELVLPTNCITIKLEQTDRYFWEADLPDPRIFGNAKWFFSIASGTGAGASGAGASGTGEAELITGTPALVKFCSAKFVPELVKRALPGLRLTHVSTPPAALSPRIRNQYFTVNRSGPCWDHLTETRRVGVYVPGEITQPELELLVLLDQ